MRPMANEDRWREDRDRYRDDDRRGREDRERWRGGGGGGDDDYGRRGSEGRMAYGREGSADIYGGDYGRERGGGGGSREGVWGRGGEGRGYSREGGRRYRREDLGGSGHGGGHRPR